MNDHAERAALRKRFCRFYLLLGNGQEAAVMAGVAPEEAAGYAAEMLRSPLCRNELRRLAAQGPVPIQSLVLTGLTRLAFGKANDAVKLVFADELPPPQVLDTLDLFHVSELKRVKGGGVEVRLFDRQKALERLLECADSADSAAAANALLAALAVPAEVKDSEHNDEDTSLFT